MVGGIFNSEIFTASAIDGIIISKIKGIASFLFICFSFSIRGLRKLAYGPYNLCHVSYGLSIDMGKFLVAYRQLLTQLVNFIPVPLFIA